MAYHVHLKSFDGPLDLLLHLIESAQLDIKDIFVSEITEQYLEYMGEVNELDMDRASEFIQMAATLVYIKSRSLLPKVKSEEIVDEEDPEEALIRQLREYKAFKEAGQKFEELYEDAYHMLSKLPEEVILPPKETELKDCNIDKLFAAFNDLLSRKNDLEQVRSLHEIKADKYIVRNQIRKIRSMLKKFERFEFYELFSSDSGKMEIIVTFMALLDMLMRNEVSIEQDAPYCPIYICQGAVNGEKIDDENVLYMDEDEG